MAATLLTQNPLFAVFTPEQLERIAPHMVRKDFPQGAEIARINDPSDALYLLEAGAVGVYARAPAHTLPTMVSVIEPGDAHREARRARPAALRGPRGDEGLARSRA